MEPPRELLFAFLNNPSRSLSEDELILLWRYLCPRLDGLRTVQGTSIRLMDRGEVRQSSGPDIVGAKLEMDGVTRVGEVEVHRQTADWYHHGHHRNKQFNGVILHLVMTGEPEPVRCEDERWIDTLVLGDFLDELRELLDGLEESDLISRRRRMKRPCYREEPSEDAFGSKLDSIGMAWLTKKASAFRTRGPEAVPRALIGALGYSRNHANFRRFAERIDLTDFRSTLRRCSGTDAVEGYLLGLGGWLNSDNYDLNRTMRRRRKVWREQFSGTSNPVECSNWTRSGVRPHARPVRRWAMFGWTTRRLLLAGYTWKQWFLEELKSTVVRAGGIGDIVRELSDLFSLPNGNYWKYHYSPEDSSHQSVPSPVGPSWCRQLTMNLILPFFYYQSIQNGNTSVRSSVKSLLETFPATMGNRRTRRVERQWGFREGSFEWSNGLRQQAAVHLYKQGCKRGRCELCPFNQSDARDTLELFDKER